MVVGGALVLVAVGGKNRHHQVFTVSLQEVDVDILSVFGLDGHLSSLVVDGSSVSHHRVESKECRYRRLVEDFCCEGDRHLTMLAVLVAHRHSQPDSGCLENLWRTSADSVERIACGRSGFDLCAFLLQSIQPGSSAEVWDGTRIGYDAFSAVSRHRFSSGI